MHPTRAGTSLSPALLGACLVLLAAPGASAAAPAAIPSPPTGDAQVYAITSAGAALLAPTDKDRVGVVRLVESEVERMLAMLPAHAALLYTRNESPE